MKYFIAILASAVGILLVIKAEWFYENFGAIEWAEAHMGTAGGSRLLYKLIGITFIVLAVFGVTGVLGEIIIGTLGSLFGLK